MTWEQLFMEAIGSKSTDKRRITAEQRRFIKTFQKHGVDRDDAEEILRNLGIIDKKEEDK